MHAIRVSGGDFYSMESIEGAFSRLGGITGSGVAFYLFKL